MDMTAWLKTWLARHPLKEPSAMDRAQYTAEVMTKVRTLGSRAPSPAPVRLWLPWPRLALTAATAAVGIAAICGTLHYQTRQLTEQIHRDAQLLAALGEAPLEAVAKDDVDLLAEDMHTVDAFILAESQTSDEQWIDQTLQLLNRFNEELGDHQTSGGASENAPDEEWLQELKLLDEGELAASS